MQSLIHIPESGIYEQMLLASYASVPGAIDSGVPNSVKLEAYRKWISGEQGAYRAHFKPLIRANNDQTAIEIWLGSVGEKSPNTLRSYRKEVERFVLWSRFEICIPISGMTIEDLKKYETFLANPVSRHAGTSVPHIQWVSTKVEKPVNEKSKTDKPSRRVSWRFNRKPVIDDKKPLERVKTEWSPFDGPLSHKSIDYAMGVLKSMYSYLVDVGYISVNPLKKRKNIAPKKQKKSVERYLSEETWAFLFNFIETMFDRIPPDADKKTQLQMKRLAHQRIMIFASLYLLGVRLSELINLRMRDFVKSANSKNKSVQYWAMISGKGNKTRKIPVSHDLLQYIRNYRAFLNETSNHLPEGKFNLEPMYTDDSYLILSKSGSKPLTSTTIYRAVRDAMDDALQHYTERKKEGDDLRLVFPEQLENASTHWMRHTSATHQLSKGVSLENIKDFLGHADYNTTLIYSHTDTGKWEAEIENFKIK